MTAKRCTDCKDGEHENFDDDVQSVIVFDPKSRKIHKIAYLCSEHRTMYEDDGYTVQIQKGA